MQLDSDFTRINHQDVFLIIEIGYLPFFFYLHIFDSTLQLSLPFNARFPRGSSSSILRLMGVVQQQMRQRSSHSGAQRTRQTAPLARTTLPFMCHFIKFLNHIFKQSVLPYITGDSKLKFSQITAYENYTIPPYYNFKLPLAIYVTFY